MGRLITSRRRGCPIADKRYAIERRSTPVFDNRFRRTLGRLQAGLLFYIATYEQWERSEDVSFHAQAVAFRTRFSDRTLKNRPAYERTMRILGKDGSSGEVKVLPETDDDICLVVEFSSDCDLVALIDREGSIVVEECVRVDVRIV